MKIWSMYSVFPNQCIICMDVQVWLYNFLSSMFIQIQRYKKDLAGFFLRLWEVALAHYIIGALRLSKSSGFVHCLCIIFLCNVDKYVSHLSNQTAQRGIIHVFLILSIIEIITQLFKKPSIFIKMSPSKLNHSNLLILGYIFVGILEY